MTGHGFTRERVKEYISRLRDEDADKITSIAEEAYKAGLAGMTRATPSGVIDNDVASLCLRLGLYDGEIDGIQSEALEAGRLDGGHLQVLPNDDLSRALDQMLDSFGPQVVLRSLATSFRSRAERSVTRNLVHAAGWRQATAVALRAAEVVSGLNLEDS